MKLTLTKDEAFDLLKFLKESSNKHKSLAALAGARSSQNKYRENAEKLWKEHNTKSQSATNLINRVVEQL